MSRDARIGMVEELAAIAKANFVGRFVQLGLEIGDTLVAVAPYCRVVVAYTQAPQRNPALYDLIKGIKNIVICQESGQGDSNLHADKSIDLLYIANDNPNAVMVLTKMWRDKCKRIIFPKGLPGLPLTNKHEHFEEL